MGIHTIILLCDWRVGAARKRWQPRPFMIFSINGIVYALGDYLEMASMKGMSGAGYQILQQSRIILTAVLMIPAKGVYQTRLQWVLLSVLMAAMSCYMVIVKGSKGGGGGGNTFMSVVMAFLKVIISCMGAVISDRFMKE